jgi:hypothetical protein
MRANKKNKVVTRPSKNFQNKDLKTWLKTTKQIETMGIL